MKQSTKRLASSLLALVFVVGAIVLFTSLIQPAYSELSRMRGEEQAKRAYVDQQKQIVEKVKTIIASYESGAEVQKLVSLAMPSMPDVAEAVGQVSSIGALHNLSVQNFSASAEEAPKASTGAAALPGDQFKPKMPLTVTVRTHFVGTYKDMKDFLKDIETNARIMDVTSLSISPADKPTVDLYGFDVNIIAYYQP